MDQRNLPLITTSSELRAARLMLGLSIYDARELFCLGKVDHAKDREKASTLTVHEDWAETYTALENALQDLLDHIARERPAILVAYSSDEVFKDFNALWAERLFGLSAVHFMGCARAREELWEENPMALVTLLPDPYREWASTHNAPLRDPASQARWALEHVKRTKVLPKRAEAEVTA